MERIDFDSEFWKDMLLNLKLFWNTYVLPKLLLVKVPLKTFEPSNSQFENDMQIVNKILLENDICINVI